MNAQLKMILIAALVATSAQASFKIQPKFWYHLSAVPVYAFAGLQIHEGSHALAMLASGKRVDAYKAYPHMDGPDFMFGAVYGAPGDVGTYLAPTISSVTLLAASDLILSLTDSNSWYAPILWFAGMVMPLIDLTRNWNNFGFNSDISRVSYLTQTDRTAMTITADIILAAALFEVGRQGYRIFVTQEPAAKTPISIVPKFGNGMTGIGIGGQF